MQRLKSKVINLVGMDNPYVLILKSMTQNYTFYGTVTLSVNTAITATGTPREGMMCTMVFNSAITAGVNSFTILGTAINKTVIKTPFLVLCKYTNGAWIVSYTNFVPASADGTTIINQDGSISVNKIGNTQFDSSDKLAYTNMDLAGKLLNTDLHTSFAMPLAQLAAVTASRILASDGSGVMTALDTGTYPSLAELVYLKGTTSAVQTQLNAVVANFANYVTSTALSSALSAYSTTAQMNSAISAAVLAAVPLWNGTTLTTATDLSAVGTLYQNYLLNASSGAVNVILPDSTIVAANTPLRLTLTGAANASTITPKVAGQLLDMTNATSAVETLSAVGQFRHLVALSGKWQIVAK